METETEQVFTGVVRNIQVLIPLSGIVDVPLLRQKLGKSLNKIENEANTLAQRLGNSKFIAKAPEEVVTKTHNALEEARQHANILRERLQHLHE